MEEIDIIELLQRVKEGKAPKKIEMGRVEYRFSNYSKAIRNIYETIQEGLSWFDCSAVALDTKIKILDKPIIEELPKWITQRDGEVTQSEGKRLEMAEKINEIIKWINEKD